MNTACCTKEFEIELEKQTARKEVNHRRNHKLNKNTTKNLLSSFFPLPTLRRVRHLVGTPGKRDLLSRASRVQTCFPRHRCCCFNNLYGRILMQSLTNPAPTRLSDRTSRLYLVHPPVKQECYLLVLGTLPTPEAAKYF